MQSGILKHFSSWLANLYEKYGHLLILSYFFIYLAWFGYVERTVTTHFHVIHVPLDDVIPFCEYFIIPYLLWFVYVAIGIVYMAFHDKTGYYKLCGFLFTGMTIFLIISTIYPNGHYLRPVTFEHDNIFIQLCKFIYSTDTPTNLFPSIHVYNSIGIHLAVINNKELSNNQKITTASFILMVSIILSTMFLKQHSVFDVASAFVLACIMSRVIYRHSWSHAAVPQKSHSRLA